MDDEDYSLKRYHKLLAKKAGNFQLLCLTKMTDIVLCNLDSKPVFYNSEFQCLMAASKWSLIDGQFYVVEFLEQDEEEMYLDYDKLCNLIGYVQL